MVKRGKGKLRTALANHHARSLQRKAEKQHAEAREAALSRKPKSKTLLAKPKPKKHVSPFAPDDTILLLGEGNFSFTLSLLCEPHCHPPHQLLATSFDTEREVCEKYPDAHDILAQIRQRAGAHADSILAFGVDAGALQKSVPVTGGRSVSPHRWSKVWFGFPHVGAGHKDEQRNVLANQLLLLRFFVSVAPYLTRGPIPTYAANVKKIRNASDDDEDDDDDDHHESLAADQDQQDLLDIHDPAQYEVQEAHAKRPLQPPIRRGSVLVTLRNSSPYTLWNVPMLAKRLPTVLTPIVASAPALPRHMHPPTLQDVERNEAYYTLWRSFEFFPQDWPNYSHRRTVGWIEGVSTSENQDLLRRTTQTGQPGKHVGTGECRTWELGLRDS